MCDHWQTVGWYVYTGINGTVETTCIGTVETKQEAMQLAQDTPYKQGERVCVQSLETGTVYWYEHGVLRDPMDDIPDWS